MVVHVLHARDRAMYLNIICQPNACMGATSDIKPACREQVVYLKISVSPRTRFRGVKAERPGPCRSAYYRTRTRGLRVSDDILAIISRSSLSVYDYPQSVQS